MTHDPLCPVSKNIATCLHCNGENNNTGRSNYCSDCWDNYVVIYPEPVPECQCDLIAKVRADMLAKCIKALDDHHPRCADPCELCAEWNGIRHDLENLAEQP